MNDDNLFKFGGINKFGFIDRTIERYSFIKCNLINLNFIFYLVSIKN